MWKRLNKVGSPKHPEGWMLPDKGAGSGSVWGLSQQDAPVGCMRWLREGTGFLPLQCPLCWPGLSGRVPRGSFFSNPMFISVFTFIYDF